MFTMWHNPLKPREREREIGRIAKEYKQRENVGGRSERHFISGGGGRASYS
jgi:hypothetical protein